MPNEQRPQTTENRRIAYGWACTTLAVFLLVIFGAQAPVPLWLAVAAFGAMKILEPV